MRKKEKAQEKIQQFLIDYFDTVLKDIYKKYGKRGNFKALRKAVIEIMFPYTDDPIQRVLD